MSIMSEWFPYFSRVGMRVPVARAAYSNFAGTDYVFARHPGKNGKKGRPVKFWTRKAAQAYADKLNKEAEGSV
jgi:hypothetical protein